MPENHSEEKMNALCEASGLVRQIAAPATGKAALLRAYRKLGSWTYNRVKDVYYADGRIKISADEIDELRAIAGLHGDSASTTNDPTITELRGQLAVVARHLRALDPTFTHPWAEALGVEAHLARGQENPTDRKVGK